jgi:hypothetical protein
LDANSAARCLGELGVMQRDATQATEQHVSARRKPQASWFARIVVVEVRSAYKSSWHS